MPAPKPLDLRNPYLAAVLTWFVPGLGQIYQRRYGKGLLFLVCVLGLFLFGCQLGHWRVVYFRWNDEEWRYQYLAQVGAGAVALPALLHKPEWRTWLPEPLADFEVAPSPEELDKLHFTYGTPMDIAAMYTMIAGLLNILAVYDALAGPALYEEEQRELGGHEPDGHEGASSESPTETPVGGRQPVEGPAA